jgi:hypothetical protein
MVAMVYVYHLGLMAQDIEKMRHTLKDKQGNMLLSNKNKSSVKLVALSLIIYLYRWYIQTN